MEGSAKFVSLVVLILSLVVYWYKRPVEDILQDRLSKVLDSMLDVEAKHKLPDSPRVAVGYGACRDLFVPAKYMVENDTWPENPQHYLQIENRQELLEMFSYFFRAGAAAERFTPSDALFSSLVSTAVLGPHNWATGGNAPVMATRFAREGADVLLAARMTPYMTNMLEQRVQVAGDEVDEDDIHLIWEYKAGEVWGEVAAPRANRFIIHSDQNNPRMSSVEKLGEKLPEFQPQLLVVSGLQMMDNFPFKEGERLERIVKIQEQMVGVGSNIRVHFEMASFVDSSLLEDLSQHIIPYADSLGMNEQELPNLHSLLLKGEVSVVSNSNPRIAVVLDQMRDVYKFLSTDKGNGNRPLTRIHVHTLAYQAILTKKGSAWKNSGAAAVKASLTANRHVCGSPDISVEKSFLIMDDSFTTSSREGARRVPFDSSQPTACWDEDEIGVSICLAPVLVCSQAVQTAGGGDNVSAAGLVMQI